MIPRIILFLTLAFAFWAIRRDTKNREGLSAAIWIPTLWMAVLASRPFSAWFVGQENEFGYSLEGSPIDAMFYLALIVMAMMVLARRQVDWGGLIRKNWAVFLFYGFLLFSVLWANSSFISFKRWFKEFGNILLAMVILTEANPQQAFRAVFVRCAYLLIPMSLVLIRYFPDIGRHYTVHSGEIEPIGVTSQKNSLGAMVLVCGFVLIWELFEARKRQKRDETKMPLEMYLHAGILLIGLYLLHLCDSKTSMLCLVLGGGILAATNLRMLRDRLYMLTRLAFIGIVVFFAVDQMFGIKEMIVQMLGRDMTFTGRTDVWDALLKVGTDPMLGTGFMSFWDDTHFRAKLPIWVAYSAHNGYLEIYLAGGYAGVAFLTTMLVATGLRLNRALKHGDNYAVVCFAVFVVALLANFSESNFAVMTPVGFLFLLAALDYGVRDEAEQTAEAGEAHEDDDTEKSSATVETDEPIGLWTRSAQ